MEKIRYSRAFAILIAETLLSTFLLCGVMQYVLSNITAKAAAGESDTETVMYVLVYIDGGWYISTE
ncbi:MAG: hypothetical protein PHY47_20010 [Lachnospiraceae bacterium]|nr:hypothetical protein [Lachnospiraceae bacterium]